MVERILANRLAFLAHDVGLIAPNQSGSLPSLAASDAVATLAQHVDTHQRYGRVASSMFLDIKGGFNHVSPQKLDSILAKARTPPYITAWVRCFLSNRQYALLFQGSPRTILPVDVGTVQGSPIFPLLFMIYVSSLHICIPGGIIISYVDDLAITVGSKSYRTNMRLLQKAYQDLRKVADALSLSFSLPKTDLIH